VLSNKELVINGNDYETRDGTCIRDYIHVSDLAQAHLEAVCLAEGFKFGEYRSYNLGTGKGYSNQEVLEQVAAYAGTKLNLSIGPRREGDPAQLYADPSKFMQDTSWQPSHSSIDNITSSTFNWFKKTYYEN
jgi:UDP-glucose 4-epimerase